MIRQKTDKPTIDKTLQKDTEQAGQLLKNLARQLNAEAHIQALAAKSISISGKEIIHAEVVFLTEKQDDDVAIQRIKNWIGIKKQLAEGELFSGKISGNTTINEALVLNMQLYHFDHYPARRLSEAKKTLKIVVYDPAYEAQYKNWQLAREILAKDPAVCLLINIQPLTETEEEQQLKINGLYTQHLHLGDLGTSITALFEDETIQHKTKIARLRNHINYMDKVYRLILQDIKDKTQQLRARAMLNHKKQWQHQQKDAGLSSKDVSNLKTGVNDRLKQLAKAIDYAIDNFEKEDEHYVKLEHEISSFFGFIEQKNGKYLTFRMAEGAIQDKVNKANAALGNFFDTAAHMVNDRFHEAIVEIKNRFAAWKLQSSDQVTLPAKIASLSEEFLLDDSVASGKSYEKQVPAKGIGSLLMELRTPLFMLMPFMMIFMLFAALTGSSKKGEISSDTSYNNKRCIAITELPESWDSPNDFIAEVEKKWGKGHFFKDISDGKDIISEPQLATKTETSSDFRGATKIIETIDYYVDVNTNPQIIYLYLEDNADREFVIKELFDPAAKLLAAPPSRGGSGMGIGKIIRVMSSPGLKKYNYFIIVGLVALISWYITTRKRGMDKELRSAKEREQKKLNEDLRQHISKNIKQQLQRWKVKLIDQLSSRHTALQQNVENLVNTAMENNKQKKAQEYTIIQKRLTAIKSEKTFLSSLKSEQRKVQSKLSDLKSKMARLA